MVANPIEQIQKSIGKSVLIKVKRNRVFKGTLKSYDMHMNVLLDNVSYSYKFTDDQGTLKEVNETFDQIIVRGDNIVFVECTPLEKAA